MTSFHNDGAKGRVDLDQRAKVCAEVAAMTIARAGRIALFRRATDSTEIDSDHGGWTIAKR
jgi:hypothetical protein